MQFELISTLQPYIILVASATISYFSARTHQQQQRIYDKLDSIDAHIEDYLRFRGSVETDIENLKSSIDMMKTDIHHFRDHCVNMHARSKQ
jgi:peptidoglycan hydrolase CwlO-like protein